MRRSLEKFIEKNKKRQREGCERGKVRGIGFYWQKR